jgi:pimeloyl-ACP methyl ester carboxylesterase
MKLLALVRDPEGIARFFTSLGLPTTAPPLAPARAPPYWQSRAHRWYEAPHEIVHMPGGHFLHREHPERFTQELLRLLS